MFAKVFTIIILFWFLNYTFGLHYTWDNQLHPNPAVQPSPFCKECNTIEDHDNSMKTLVTEPILSNTVSKRMRDQEYSERKLGPHKIDILHSSHTKVCSCNHEKRMIDLGGDYFPRYILDMVCFPGGCSPNYECRPKRFKLWVMRRRQEDEDEGVEPVPKELRQFWIGESVVTTIDCECIA